MVEEIRWFSYLIILKWALRIDADRAFLKGFIKQLVERYEKYSSNYPIMFIGVIKYLYNQLLHQGTNVSNVVI